MSSDETAPAPPGAGRAMAMLPVIALLVVAYIGLGSLLGIGPLFAGFFFLLYWAGINHADPKQFAPALLGALGGLVPAWLLVIMPAMFGTAGLVGVLLLIVVAVYVQIREHFPLVINLAFMLFLTLGSAPPISKEGDFAGMAFAILLSAGFFGGVLFLVGRLGKRRAAPAEAG